MKTKTDKDLREKQEFFNICLYCKLIPRYDKTDYTKIERLSNENDYILKNVNQKIVTLFCLNLREYKTYKIGNDTLFVDLIEIFRLDSNKNEILVLTNYGEA